MGIRIERKRFEELTAEAVQSLPAAFRNRLRNVVVAVEDHPSAEDAAEVGVPADELLGLFRGVPYEDQDGFFDVPPAFPDEVILYQRNLEAICESEKELIEEIQETIVHEIGHYFGLTDEGMEEME